MGFLRRAASLSNAQKVSAYKGTGPNMQGLLWRNPKMTAGRPQPSVPPQAAKPTTPSRVASYPQKG